MGRNQRIKDALKAKGISQEKLAEKLNITQAAVGKQLNKDEEIDSIEFINAVAELTGYSFQWFVMSEEMEKASPAIQPEIKYTVEDKIQKLEKIVSAQELTISLLQEENRRIKNQLEAKEKHKTT